MFMLLHKPYLVKLSTKGEVVKIVQKIVHIFYKGSLLAASSSIIVFCYIKQKGFCVQSVPVKMGIKQIT